MIALTHGERELWKSSPAGWARKLLEDRVIGIMHVLMFWGFFILSADMFDLATANWFSGEALPSTLVGPWNGIVELGYTMGLVGCVAALTRRVVFTPEKLKGKSQLEGNFILFLIMTITTTSFIVESGESPSSTWEPLGYWFAEQGVTEGTGNSSLLGSYVGDLYLLRTNSNV